MSEFIYQEPFPIECDKTQYRLLTKEYVRIVECDGRRILKVDPKGIWRVCGLHLPTRRRMEDSGLPLSFLSFALVDIANGNHRN